MVHIYTYVRGASVSHTRDWGKLCFPECRAHLHVRARRPARSPAVHDRAQAQRRVAWQREKKKCDNVERVHVAHGSVTPR